MYSRRWTSTRKHFYFEKALEIEQKSLPSDYLDLVCVYEHIGTVLYKTGERLKAVEYFEQALKIVEHSFPVNHQHIQSLKNHLARVKQGL